MAVKSARAKLALFYAFCNGTTPWQPPMTVRFAHEGLTAESLPALRRRPRGFLPEGLAAFPSCVPAAARMKPGASTDVSRP